MRWKDETSTTVYKKFDNIYSITYGIMRCVYSKGWIMNDRRAGLQDPLCSACISISVIPSYGMFQYFMSYSLFLL